MSTPFTVVPFQLILHSFVSDPRYKREREGDGRRWTRREGRGGEGEGREGRGGGRKVSKVLRVSMIYYTVRIIFPKNIRYL